MRLFLTINTLILLSFLNISCAQPGISARADVSLRWAAFSATDVLKIYALAPQRSDGADLKCAALQNQQPPLDDSSLQIYAQSSARASELESGAVDLVLDKIAAGENRIFVAEVRDSGNQRVGFGCTEGVSIVANSSTEVTLTVNEL